MEIILSEVPNEILERKSKFQGEWLEFEGRKSIKDTRRMNFFDDGNTNWKLFGFTREMGSETEHKSYQITKKLTLFYTNQKKILTKIIHWIHKYNEN